MENIRDFDESSSSQHHHKMGHHHEHHKHKHHQKCHKLLFQFVQLETRDDEVHQGILHSYDDENVYLLVSTQGGNDNNRLFIPFGGFGLFGFPLYGIRRFGPFYPIWW